MSSYSTSRTQNVNAPVTANEEVSGAVGGRAQAGWVNNQDGNVSVGDRVIGGNVSLSGEKSVLNMLDGGAIEKAFNFAGGSVEQVLDLAATAFSNAQQAQGSLLDILGQQSQNAANAADPEGATEKRNMLLLVGFGALLVMAYVMKRGK